MNNKAFTISLVIAAAAVFMIYSYISSKEQEITTRYGTNKGVVVAKRDIKELDEIHENMLDIVSLPAKFTEPGVTTSKDEVVGFIATVPIRKGEQLTLNKIISPGMKTGLSKQVTPGKRAMSLSVDDVNAVSRLIKPGDRIDLLATMEPPGAPKGSYVTKMVLQDVPVLAVGEFITAQTPRKLERDDLTGKDVVRNLSADRNFTTLTIELDPQFVSQIALLRDSRTPMTLVLRNNDDTERVNLGAVTLNDLLGGDAARVRTPAAQR